MKDAFEKNTLLVKSFFTDCETTEKKYEKIISLGRELSPFPEDAKVPGNIVQGCQSQMFLTSTYSSNKLFFSAWSDALISAGLAYLMMKAYSGLTPETIIKAPPHFLEDLGLASLLSPSRANGVKSLYLKMQQLALKELLPS